LHGLLAAFQEKTASSQGVLASIQKEHASSQEAVAYNLVVALLEAVVCEPVHPQGCSEKGWQDH